MRDTLGTSWDTATNRIRMNPCSFNWSFYDPRTIIFHGSYWFSCYHLPILKKHVPLYHMGYDHLIGLLKEPNKAPDCIQMILSLGHTWLATTRKMFLQFRTLLESYLSTYFILHLKHLPEYSQMVTLSDPILLWTISRITGCVMEIFIYLLRPRKAIRGRPIILCLLALNVCPIAL